MKNAQSELETLLDHPAEELGLLNDSTNQKVETNIDLEWGLPPFGPGVVVVISGEPLCRGSLEGFMAIFPPDAVVPTGPGIVDVSTDGWRTVTWIYEKSAQDTDAGAIREELLAAAVKSEQVRPRRLVVILSLLTTADEEMLDWAADIIANQIRVRVRLGNKSDRREIAEELFECLWDGSADRCTLPEHLSSINPRFGRVALEEMLQQLGFDGTGPTLRSAADA